MQAYPRFGIFDYGSRKLSFITRFRLNNAYAKISVPE